MAADVVVPLSCHADVADADVEDLSSDVEAPTVVDALLIETAVWRVVVAADFCSVVASFGFVAARTTVVVPCCLPPAFVVLWSRSESFVDVARPRDGRVDSVFRADEVVELVGHLLAVVRVVSSAVAVAEMGVAWGVAALYVSCSVACTVAAADAGFVAFGECVRALLATVLEACVVCVVASVLVEWRCPFHPALLCQWLRVASFASTCRSCACE